MSGSAGGLSVLDATAENMHNFAQGSFELVVKDLEAFCWEEHGLEGAAGVAAVRSACEAVGVLDAFAVRRELINYKKVCLHMLLRIQGTERRLARLTTFYFRVHGALIQEGGGLYVHHESYTELANALQRCRGLLLAVRDGRDLAKSICCVPRAPCYSAASVPRLSGLPNSLAVAKAARDADLFLSHGEAAVNEGSGSPAHPASVSWCAASRTEGQEAQEMSAGASAAFATLELVERSIREALGWHPDVSAFVRASLIARGAAKSLAIVAELRRAVLGMQALLPRLESLLLDLQPVVGGGLSACGEDGKAQKTGSGAGAPGSDGIGSGADDCYVRIHANRHDRVLSAASAGAADVCKWLDVIGRVKASLPAPDSPATRRCGEAQGAAQRVREWIAHHTRACCSGEAAGTDCHAATDACTTHVQHTAHALQAGGESGGVVEACGSGAEGSETAATRAGGRHGGVLPGPEGTQTAGVGAGPEAGSLQAQGARSRLFMAGDNVSCAGCAMYLPRAFVADGLPALAAPLQQVADTHEAELLRCARRLAWPPSGDELGLVRGSVKCRGGCGGSFSKIWVDNEVRARVVALNPAS